MSQPTRRGTIREERRFDKTQLRVNRYLGVIHRDWIAHCLRWGWVSRQIEHGDSVLDVGCGQDMPLARVLSGRIGSVGGREKYVGVDLNKIKKPFKAKWCTVIDEFDFIGDYKMLKKYAVGGYDDIINFEVIEHMGVNDGKKLLKNIYNLLSNDGVLYLSTPVFNGKAAANHIHEYRIDELRELLEFCGFKIIKRIGTFASANDIKKVLDSHERIVYDKLHDWFNGDILSIIFASNYPDQSRNILWCCKKK